MHCLHCSGVSFFSFFIYFHSFPLVLSSLPSPIQLTVHHKRHPHTPACTTPPSSSFTTASDYHQHHFLPYPFTHLPIFSIHFALSSPFALSNPFALPFSSTLHHFQSFLLLIANRRTSDRCLLAHSMRIGVRSIPRIRHLLLAFLIFYPSPIFPSSLPSLLRHFTSQPAHFPSQFFCTFSSFCLRNVLNFCNTMPSCMPYAPQLSRLVFPHETSHVQPNGCKVSV